MLILFLGILFSIISAIEETQNGSANNKTYDGPIVGIDLGTTYSSVCYQQNEEIQLIEDEYGLKSMPTVVAIVNDRFLVGQKAKNQAIENPNNTFYDIKRYMGRKFFNPVVQNTKNRVAYSMKNQSESIYIYVKEFQNESPSYLDPTYIQAKVLNVLKKISESYLKHPNISNVVITVPSTFDDDQKKATIQTAKIAGLNVVELLSEPKAAVIAYAKNYEEGEKNIMVFDFGGGTLDISVVKIKQGYFEDINHQGELNLGGEDFEWVLVDEFIKQIKAVTKININDKDTENRTAKQILKIEAQKAKETLSQEQVVQIKIPNFFEGYDFIYNLTREKFEKLSEELFKRMNKTIESAQKDGKNKTIQIDEVILVGGTSRIPKVQQIVEDYFKSIKIIKDKIQEELVCIGAAMQANFLTTHVQKRNIPIEIKKTPMSYGIEVQGELISKIIPKLTKYPLSLSKLYTTSFDYQAAVEIAIYQGEEQFTAIENKIGQYQLSGIQKAKQGIPQIKVTFSLDQNGILYVNAIDLNTQSSKNHVVATNINDLSEEALIRLTKQNEKDQLLQEEQDQAIANLNYYINEFMPSLLVLVQSNNLEYSIQLSIKLGQKKDEIQQIITSSSKWLQQQSKETNTKREHYEKELQNLNSQIKSILYEKYEDL